MKNVLVVSNYSAGRKKAVLNKKKLRKFLYENCNNFKIIEISELEETSVSEYDTIVAMGGDGTINKVLPFIINTDKTLGIIPCGTANLLASKLHISSNLKKALNVISKGKTKKIDVIKIGDKNCILRCGFGYDSDIICKTPQSLKNQFGYFAYFIAGILFALRLTPKRYEITYDDSALHIDSTCLIVANASNMYRNLISLSDNSSLDDGIFDIFILKTKNPLLFFLELIRIIFGVRKSNSRACYLKASTLKIQNNWITCHIDGEKTKLKREIDVQIVHDAVNVICANT